MRYAIPVAILFLATAAFALTYLPSLQWADSSHGADYTAESLHPEERSALERAGSQIRILPFEAGYSTSGLLEKIPNRART